ncbi:MAG: glycosyltransferase [Candidatus Omnitrophica bacterium]|nr:glycosyltransferase [Candidatus Omnitrophota bacterium]
MSQPNRPLVSIIIPSFNMAALAVRAIESVLSQTYTNTEVIFVDDGSTDNTRERLEPYKDKIKYIFKPNGGVCSARNVGLREARGEFIGLLDSDDEYMPEKVERCLNFLQEHPDYGFVHTDTYLVDKSGQVIEQYQHPRSRVTGRITDKLLLGNFIANPTSFFRRECYERCGGYEEALFPPGDWDLWLRIANKFKVGYIDQPLSKYSVLSNSCFNDLERTKREEKWVLDRFFRDNPEINQGVKRRAYSEFHIRNAQCHFVKGQQEQCRKEFTESFQSCPWNGKWWLLGGYYLLAKERLRARLRRRILRSEWVANKT